MGKTYRILLILAVCLIPEALQAQTTTCPAPTGITVDSITTYSATISWTSGGTETLWEPTVGDSTYYPTTNTYTASNLHGSTQYIVSLRAICAPGDTSTAVLDSFSTACPHVITYRDLPFFEDFECYEYGREASFSPCWDRGAVALMGSVSDYYAPFPERADINGDTVGLVFFGTSNPSIRYYNWVALPRVDDSVHVADLELSFLVKRPSSDQYQTIVVVGVSSDLTTEAAFLPVDTIDLSDEQIYSHHPVVVTFENYEGDGKHILIQAAAPDSTSWTSNYFFIDNVMLRRNAGCPTLQHVRVTRTTADSVFATWDPVAGADTMWVYVGTPGFNIDTVTPQFFHNNVCAVGGLSPDTEYELVVVASCSDTVGYVSYPAPFRTLCTPIVSLPFVESFEDVTGYIYPSANGYIYPSATDNNLPSCWRHYYRGNDWRYLGYPIVYGDPSFAHSGNNSLSLISSRRTQIAVMPLTDSVLFPVSNLQVSFWMRSYDQYTSIVVGVMSNPADTNTFVPVDTCQITSFPALYSPYTVGFANYTGPHGHIAFKPLPPSVGSRNPYLYIDDITIAERPPCVPIEAIHAQATQSAALLTWDYNPGLGNPTGFVVRYRCADDSTAIPATMTTTTAEVLLTGLGIDSTYWVTVESLCDSTHGTACTSFFSTQALPCLEWDTGVVPGDTIVLGNPGTGTTAMFPVNATVPTSYVQHLFLASEIPVSGPTTLKGIGFDYTYNQPLSFANNCTAYLAHTTLDSMSNSFVGDQQMVYTGSLVFLAPGWNYVLFNQGLFEYDGVSNLCVTIEKKFDRAVGSNYTFHHETTASQMTCWGWRVHPSVGSYTINSTGTNMRSNTRLITCGDSVHCSHWANCIPPIVRVDTIDYGEYKLSWIPGYGEYSWDVDYRAVDSSSWTHATRFTTNTSYTFSMYDLNLELDTRYEFRVLANCNDCDDTLYTSVFITTPCDYMHIPFLFSFEGLPTGSYSNPSHIHCWHHLNDGYNGYNGYPVIGSGGHTGNRCLSFSPMIAQYDYGSYHVMVLPQVDVSANPINTLYMSFWANGAANSDNIPVMYVGVMTDPTDINTFQYVDSIVIDISLSGWQQYEVHLENYNGDGEYIALRANRPELGYISIGIDDIRIDDVPICRRVGNIKARNVTTNSATISWTRGGIETAWELTVGDSVYHTIDTFYTVNTLDSNTYYDVTVRAVCGEGDTSIPWSTYFQTPCYYLSNLPYFNDFEDEPHLDLRGTPRISYDEAFPVCWKRLNDARATSAVRYYPYISDVDIYVINGSKSLYWQISYDDAYADNMYAVLPPVNPVLFNTNDLTIAFYAKVRSSNDTNTRFIVGVMENCTDTATFVPVDTVRLTVRDTLYVVSFSNYTGTGNYIAIRCPRIMRNCDALLDDVFLTDEWCDPPTHVRAFTSDTSVTIYWNSNGNNRFIAVLGTDTVTGITDTFYTFTGLTDSTVYTYSVAAECSRRHSMFVPGSIQTECHPLTYADLPYFEDFEGYGHGRDSAISPCWRKGMSALSGTLGTLNYPYPVNCFINADTGGLAFAAAHVSANRYSSWASLPRLDDSVDVSRLEVDFLIVRPSALVRPIPTTCVVVGVSTDQAMPEDSASMATYTAFVPIDTIELSDEPINSINPATVRFDNYTGNGKYVVFLAPAPPPSSPSSTYNSFTLDNVTLRVATPCPTPQHVRVTRATFDSVYATWNPTRNANIRLVYIGEPGFDIGSVTPQYVYSNSCAIGGLTPDTDYELVVVASCSGDVGYPSYPVRFHTLCAPLVNLPFVEDFEGSTGYTSPVANINNLPTCWQYYNTGIEFSYRGYPIVYNNPTYAHRGWQSMSMLTGNIAVMPLTDSTLFPVSSLKVSLWIRSEMQYAHVVTGVMSDPTDTNTFVAVDTVPVVWVGGVGYPYSYHTVKFLDYTGPHGYIAFKAPQLDWGSNQPYIDDVTLDVMCQRVTDLLVTHTAPDSITITWSGAGSNYEVSIKPAADSVWPDSNISVADTTYTFTGLQPATLYQFRVRQDCTADTLGYSIWTEGIYSTRHLPCLAPNSLTVSDITNTTATFDWDPVEYESLWDVHVWFSGGLDTIYHAIATHPITLSGLSAAITYNAAIRSLCGDDTSDIGPWGDTINFATPICPDVTGLYADNVGSSSLTLHWNADSLAQNWMIEYGFQGFDQGTGTFDISNTNTYVANGLMDNTQYDFRVRAVCGSDWMSEGWASTTATTQSSSIVCDAPTDINIAVAGNTATVNWTASEGNLGFELEYGRPGFAHGSSPILPVAAPPVTISNLDYNTDYDLYVRAICEQDTYSEWSEVASFTTTPVGINGVSGASCTIHPNPTSGSTTITVSGVSGRVWIAVVDMEGREVASETLDCSGDCAKSIDVKNLSQGAYFVRITGENVSMVRKLIIA